MWKRVAWGRLFSGGRWMVWVSLALWAGLLLRPHGDTFTALDHSGYRLMAVAFGEGRGLHDEDRVLAAAPREIRESMMLFPHMDWRNTRDRSFLVSSLDGQTKSEPFFYPLAPWMAAGLERIFPGWGRDAMIPFFGLFFIGALLGLGWKAGRGWGVSLTWLLALGSPLIPWLFRGFYVEAAGGAVLALGVWAWEKDRPVLGALGIGLSCAFHPVYLIPVGLCLPLMLLLEIRWVRRGQVILAGVCGLLVLLAMTLWMCTPYGSLNPSQWAVLVQRSRIHRLMLAGVGLSLIGLLGAVLIPRNRSLIPQVWTGKWLRPCLTLAACLPLFVAVFLWSAKGQTRAGLVELFQAVRWPLGLLLLVILATVHDRRSTGGRIFAIWIVAVITLPLFAYLKGWEQMGMWSQRRLLPAYVLLAVVAVPAGAGWLRDHLNGRALWVRGLVLTLIAGATLANPIRWPAPYLMQVEEGALAAVEKEKASFGEDWVFFDYLPFSFPFAVDNRTRAFGINEDSTFRLPQVVAWLRTLMKEGEGVWLVTGYEPPTLERGLVLSVDREVVIPVQRIRSRSALPAESQDIDIRMTVLKAERLKAGQFVSADKVLDGGPLGIRHPWGGYRRQWTLESGERLPVDWSRQGSGVIGPVPPAGGTVEMVITGASGREGNQRMTVQLPWGGDSSEVEIPAEFGEVRLMLSRPEDAESIGGTGIYRLSSPTPYNPEEEGIKGFAPDLGMLVHRIRIQVVPQADESAPPRAPRSE